MLRNGGNRVWKGRGQEVISVALSATPMVDGLTSEGQGDAYPGD